MAITRVGGSFDYTANVNTDPLSVEWPEGHKPGDLAILAAVKREDAANLVMDSTGWELNGTLSNTAAGNDRAWGTWLRRAQSHAEPPVQISSTEGQQAAAAMIVLRGVHSTTALDSTPRAGGLTTGSLNPTPPAQTAVTNNVAVVTMQFAVTLNQDGISVAGAPAGYTLDPDATNVSNLGVEAVVAYLLDAGAAGSKAPGAFTNTDGPGDAPSNACFTFLVRRDPNPQSDDFHEASLDPMWEFVDPLGDCSYSLTGSGTSNARLEISVPSGTTHDNWVGANDTPRMRQYVEGIGDFDVSAKFDSTPATALQLQGFLFEDAVNETRVRYEIMYTGDGLNLAVAYIETDSFGSTWYYDAPPASDHNHLRVNKTGNVWTFYSSPDGTTWTQINQTTQAVSLTHMGVHVGNTTANPAFTAQVDYFLNRAKPFAPEDPVANDFDANPFHPLAVFSLPAADPHTLTIQGATAGKDIWLIVHAAATTATPAAWSLIDSFVDANGTYIFHLDGADNPGGDIVVPLDHNGARGLVGLAIESNPVDTTVNAVYSDLAEPANANASATWGTGLHTFSAREAVFAIFGFYEPSNGTIPTPGVDSFDNGFTFFADTGWAGTGASLDEGVHLIVGSGEDVGFTSDGVTMTLDALSGRGAVVGFLAFDFVGENPSGGGTGWTIGVHNGTTVDTFSVGVHNGSTVDAFELAVTP